jgi:hypothetical protein
MPANRTDDHNAADGGDIGAAGEHLLCVREALVGYAEYAGLTVAEVFLPTMSEVTRRNAGGLALMDLLKALDPPQDDATSPESRPKAPHSWDDRTPMPFLMCTLRHPDTGLRVALLAAATSVP